METTSSTRCLHPIEPDGGSGGVDVRTSSTVIPAGNLALSGCASLTGLVTGTGSARLDRGYDAVMLVAVDAAWRCRYGTKAVAAGYRGVFSDRKTALIATELRQGHVSGW